MFTGHPEYSLQFIRTVVYYNEQFEVNHQLGSLKETTVTLLLSEKGISHHKTKYRKKHQSPHKQPSSVAVTPKA